MISIKFPIVAFAALILGAVSAVAELPLVSHIPDHQITSGNGGVNPTMRTPLYEISNNSTVRVYSKLQKYGNTFGTANQTGGSVFFKSANETTWNSQSLAFHQDVGNDQYWYADINVSSLSPNQVIQYYIYITFSAGAVENSFIYGGGDQGGSQVTASEAAARALPFTIRDRPAWIFHAGNRVSNGGSTQFLAKVGYQTLGDDPSTRWATDGAIYYTTDNSEPTGALGVGSGSTLISRFSYSHPDPSGQNGTGTAMWWSTAGIEVPLLTPIRYRVGFWNSANLEEKFADYQAGGSQTFTFSNGILGDPVLTVSSPTNGTLNANYTTTKLFVDEVACESEPLTISFQPGQAATQVEIVTNLNQRDHVNADKNLNGEPDGMEFNQDESIVGGGSDYYYRSYSMVQSGEAGRYEVNLPAIKTGAYRLTARWKVSGDPNWRWFTNHLANRRDHAITVSPRSAREINLYEINTLTIEARDTNGWIERSTFEDLFDAPNAPRTADGRGFNLDYLTGLGVNWLWFQPIHPPAIDGRENDPSTTLPYNPGSPYAVKNFFQVNPWMSASYTGNGGDLGDAIPRQDGMRSFQEFVSASDEKKVGIMLDAPFNHTGKDVEFDQEGVNLYQRHGDPMPLGGATEIRNYDTRFFSRNGDYAQRATLANGEGPAVAPDRGDFGKWNDTVDVYFGRYDALVNQNPADNSNYNNEGDRFFYAVPGQGSANNPENGNWTSIDFYQGPGNTLPRNTTRQTWKYFARYASYWLEKTRPAGGNRNSSTEAGLTLDQRYEWDDLGIDGLRCDFGQGLPPQAWEYITNVARSHKWNFVMMSESLDGGAVTYRSNRHFDILNENIVFPLKSAGNSTDYRSIFETRRSAYGQGLVLLNNTSHDEENYENIWFALMRYQVSNTIDGSPMIFMGQELGVSRTSGFSFYETNFGKQVAHFKKFNSMQPGWLKRVPVSQGGAGSPFGEEFLWDAFAAPGQARLSSKALRSSNRHYLNRISDGQPRNEIWAVAKYEQAGASPNMADVVFAFSNLRTEAGQSDTFNVNVAAGGSNLFGVKAGRIYNVRNIAAYAKFDSNRRSRDVWSAPRSGSDLLSNGIFVDLNPLPAAAGQWLSAPFESQYLKLYDVTPPPAPGAPVPDSALFGTVIGNEVVFTWPAASDPEGGISGYNLRIGTFPGGSDLFSGFVVGNSHSVEVPAGTVLHATVQQVNSAGIGGDFSEASAGVQSLEPMADADGDGQSNAAEHLAGTHPLLGTSTLKIRQISIEGNDVTLLAETVSGKIYQLETRSDLAAGAWDPIGLPVTSQGSSTGFTHSSGADDGKRFYRVRVVAP